MTQKEFKDQFDMYIPSNAFTVAEWDAALKSWQPYYDAMSSSAGLPIDKWLYNTSGYLPDFLDTKEQKFGHSRIGNYDHVMIYQFLDTQGNDPGRKGKYTDMYVRNKAVATVADLQDNYEKNIQDLLRKITTAKTLSDIYAVENSSEYVRFSCKTILRKITILCSVMPGSAYPHAFVWFFGEKTLENLAGILGLGPQNKKTFFEYNHEIYERAKDYAGLTAGSTKDEYVKLYSFLLSLIPKISSAKAAAAGAGVAAADEDEETTPKAGEEEGGHQIQDNGI